MTSLLPPQYVPINRTGTFIGTGQVTITTTAKIIVPPRTSRRVVLLKNTSGSPTLYIGTQSVTSTTGFALLEGESIEVNSSATVYGITTSGTATLHFIEEYD